MPQITLAEPWTYRTIERTISYPAGTFEVDAEIAAAAPSPPPPVKEPVNGNRTAKAAPQEAAVDPEE